MNIIAYKLGMMIIWITCRLGWHVWYVARDGNGEEITRICDCCGAIRKRNKTNNKKEG